MQKIDVDLAKKLATEAGPVIDDSFDMTRAPMFPGKRTDIAIIQRDAEDGSTYGRTVWYALYDNGSGVKIDSIYDTGNIHDNCHTLSVGVREGMVTAKFSYGNSKPVVRFPLSKYGLR